MRILRKAAVAFLALGLLFFTACGREEGESGAAISFTREGEVRAKIRESFEQSYYDKDELQPVSYTHLERVSFSAPSFFARALSFWVVSPGTGMTVR